MAECRRRSLLEVRRLRTGRRCCLLRSFTVYQSLEYTKLLIGLQAGTTYIMANVLQILSQVKGMINDIVVLLCNVRSVQSRYALINKLPPEILAIIFGSIDERFVPIDTINPVGSDRMRICVGLRSITFVGIGDEPLVLCRNTGTPFAFLTSTQFFRAKDFLSLSLAYSGLAPLTVDLGGHNALSDSSLLANHSCQHPAYTGPSLALRRRGCPTLTEFKCQPTANSSRL